MPESKEYSGTSRDHLDRIRKDLKGMGINMPEGASGTIAYQGVKLSIAYVEAEQKLAVQILEKPSFVPASMVWQTLEARIQKCKGNS